MKDNGFSRHKRLLNAEDYRQVFGNASFKVQSAELLILAIANERVESRLGVVVAKKQVRLAVQRNRLKRLLRESFRHRQNLEGLDIVVLARKASLNIDNAGFSETIEKLWVKLLRKRNSAAKSSK